MAIKDALSLLKSKPILGEYGAVTRPYVILDVDEYQMLLDELGKANRSRRVPKETQRQTA